MEEMSPWSSVKARTAEGGGTAQSTAPGRPGHLPPGFLEMVNSPLGSKLPARSFSPHKRRAGTAAPGSCSR